MYLLVSFLLLSLCPNKNFAQQLQKANLESKKAYQEDLPVIIFICEYCGLKKELIVPQFNFKLLENLEHFKYIQSANWAEQVQIILKKQIDTEFQSFGSKSWPPKIPFSLSPLQTKKGMIVFINYSAASTATEKSLPSLTKYILFYHDHVYIGESIKEIQNSLSSSPPSLNKRDGLRFFISKEISGESIQELEKVIKNFTADKNSIIIPYQITSEGVRYRSDIDITNKMRTIKQINQFVPNLSAQSPNGTIDVIEITRAK